MKIATMITKNSVTVNYNGETHTVLATDVAYAKIIAAIKEKRLSDIPMLMEKPRFVEQASKGEFQVRDGRIFTDGKEIPGQLGRQIMDFINEGLPFQPLMNFWRNLKGNPSFRAVNDLFVFLEKNNHPITEDGKFIAYKRVTRGADGVLRDSRTQTFVNDPGSVCEMPRNEVNEDPEQTCSVGLHVANWDYAQNVYGGHFGMGNEMIEVEVSPADVVAIPTDYNQAKMRVCRYRVRDVVVNQNENKHLVRNPEPVSNVVHDEGPEPEDCENCHGSGAVDCSGCSGDGYVDCETCHGDGYTHCDSCDADEDCDECGGNCEVACTDCGGDGSEDCGDCDGTGLVEPEETPEEIEPEEEDDGPTDPEPALNIVYHDEASMRKMSSDRLERYSDRLEEYLNGLVLAGKEDSRGEDCQRIADKILNDRGR